MGEKSIAPNSGIQVRKKQCTRTVGFNGGKHNTLGTVGFKRNGGHFTGTTSDTTWQTRGHTQDWASHVPGFQCSPDSLLHTADKAHKRKWNLKLQTLAWPSFGEDTWEKVGRRITHVNHHRLSRLSSDVPANTITYCPKLLRKKQRQSSRNGQSKDSPQEMNTAKTIFKKWTKQRQSSRNGHSKDNPQEMDTAKTVLKNGQHKQHCA